MWTICGIYRESVTLKEFHSASKKSVQFCTSERTIGGSPEEQAEQSRTLATGGQSCVYWASGKGASQLLESQWGDYSAWVALGKVKVETA